MNELFVNIKVDREERPDIDAIYMSALHMLGEQGGWPLTMFLTPDGEPFWGGTYFPPTARYGRPGFRRRAAARSPTRLSRASRDKVPQNAAARSDRERAQSSARRRRGRRRSRHALPTQAASADRAAVDPVQWRHRRRAEVSASTTFFELLWRALAARRRRRSAARCRARSRSIACARAASTIISAAASRATRSTSDWLVPHFEKMLYDNAQLIDLMTAGLAARRRARSIARAHRRDRRLAAARDDRRRTAASPRRSMPTAKARRASSTSGP